MISKIVNDYVFLSEDTVVNSSEVDCKPSAENRKNIYNVKNITQYICMTFVQPRANVFDVGPTLCLYSALHTQFLFSVLNTKLSYVYHYDNT